MYPRIIKLAKFLVLNNFLEEFDSIVKGNDFISKEDIESYTFTLGDSSKEIKKAKEQLFDLGYYYGKIDSNFDKKFQRSLKKYETRNNILYNGNLTIGTLIKIDIDHGLNISNPITNKKIYDDYDRSKAIKDYPRWSSEGTEIGSGVNFHRIGSSTNYRSAQPEISEDFFKFLNQEYEIETILNLRGSISRNGISEEEAVEGAGLKYVSIPLGDRPPTSSEWSRIKPLLDRGNTLVHCQHGADRTGSVIGRWEVESGLKDPQQAYEDTLKYGFKSKHFKGYFFDEEGNPKNPDPNRHLRKFILTAKPSLEEDVDIFESNPSGDYINSENIKGISNKIYLELKESEGFYGYVYDDATGKAIYSYSEAKNKPHIGYGTLIDNESERSYFRKYLKGKSGPQLSKEEGETFLKKEIDWIINSIKKQLSGKLTQNMFDALVHMGYNTGPYNKDLKKAIKHVNNSEYNKAAKAIENGPTRDSSGRYYEGLRTRRIKEAKMFLS